MIRLYIENQEMDVTEGFSHQITYAVDDLNNLDSKSTAFSKTIVLPGTAKNNYLLGNIFEFSNSNYTGDGANVAYNFNASKSAKCRLEINGLQIIKGVLRLMEIVRDGDSIEYEVAIFGELGGFINSLSNKKLEDLDFGAYNHTYNISTIDNYWSDTSDYIFITGTDTTLINGSPNATVEFYQNLTDYLEVGEAIEIIRTSNNVSYGERSITSVTWDGTKTTVEVSANWSPTPTTSFATKVIVKNKKGFGVYYPLIDYGNYSTNKIDYKFKTFRPALHVFEYMDKIIKGSGYTWESKFFKSDFFKRLIIPHNESKLIALTSFLFRGNSIYAEYTDTTLSGGLYQINEKLPINEIFGDLFTTTDNLTHTYTGSSTTISISAQFNTRLYYNRSFSNIDYGDYTYTLEIYKNGSATGIKFQNSGFLSGAFLDYAEASIVANLSGNLAITTNDTIEIKINTTLNPVGTGTFKFTNYVEDSFVDYDSLYPVAAEIQYNGLVELSRCIPKNVLQKDFFASILKLFYLMVTEDKYKEKHLKIEPWTWFYNLNSTSYLDWSEKLDRSQPIKIKPMSEANARYYDIKFKQDSDYFNDFYRKRYVEGYGDVRFDNQLEFAKDAETTEVIFSSTPLVGYTGKDKIVPSIFKWDGKVAGTNEENVNSIIRIMQKKGIDEVNEWNVLNETTGVLATYSKYPYAGHFDDPDAPISDINFGATKELFFSLSAGALGNNLFNTFYSSYLAEITDKDSRLVTAKFKLNDTDIFNLDFGRFIYLDGVLYRLSKIVDYTPGEICTVELLRVIYTTYDNSVNASDNPEVTINGLIVRVKNLDTEYYRNGDPIPQITDNSEWENATEGAWCYYRNETPYGIEYGKLYNWFAVNDARGLAPEGYHVPTNTELTNLFTLNSNAYAWKESGITHWNTDNGTDLYGFKALGGGERETDGTFSNVKVKARFWTDTQYDDDLSYYAGIDNESASIVGNKIDKNCGFSVRIVKD